METFLDAFKWHKCSIAPCHILVQDVETLDCTMLKMASILLECVRRHFYLCIVLQWSYESYEAFPKWINAEVMNLNTKQHLKIWHLFINILNPFPATLGINPSLIISIVNISPDLSVSKMYSLYKGTCAEKARPVSDWVYRRVFNEEPNLWFGR